MAEELYLEQILNFLLCHEERELDPGVFVLAKTDDNRPPECFVHACTVQLLFRDTSERRIFQLTFLPNYLPCKHALVSAAASRRLMRSLDLGAPEEVDLTWWKLPKRKWKRIPEFSEDEDEEEDSCHEAVAVFQGCYEVIVDVVFRTDLLECLRPIQAHISFSNVFGLCVSSYLPDELRRLILLYVQWTPPVSLQHRLTYLLG